jgi:beta-lysine 5,6-aminomutase alpha subunit
VIKLSIEREKIKQARTSAKEIVESLIWLLDGYTSTTIERTVVRFLGVDGVYNETPLPNIVVDHLLKNKAIERGAAYWLG